MDKFQAEQQEISILLNKGVKFSTPKRSFLKHLSKKKERDFYIFQPYLGTLDHLSELSLQMKIDEKVYESDDMFERLQGYKILASKTARLAAKMAAISVLNSRWKIKLFSGILAGYFLWHIQPTHLLQLAMLINKMSNFGDFTNSIRLMSTARTTAPKSLIENQNGQLA